MTTPNWQAGSQQASYLTLMQTSSNSRKQISFQNEHAVLVYPPAHRNKCQHQDRAVDQGGSTPLQVCWGSCHSVTTPASALPSSSWTDPSCPPFCWRTEKTSSCLYAPLFPSFFWDSCCSCICHCITKDFDDQLAEPAVAKQGTECDCEVSQSVWSPCHECQLPQPGLKVSVV